jgi:hypothetical protein
MLTESQDDLTEDSLILEMYIDYTTKNVNTGKCVKHKS